MFQVGIINDLKDADPKFADEQNAIDYASNWAWKTDSKKPIAVWQDDQLLHLFWFGEHLRRV